MRHLTTRAVLTSGVVVLACATACAPSTPTSTDTRGERKAAPPAATPTQDRSAPTEAPEPTAEPPEVRHPAARAATYAVVDVVDGDTVEVAYRGGESVRIIGIDTPETVSPSVPDECGGPAASRAAERLLAGQRVRLVFDPSQGRRDKYGRLLAYVQVRGTGDFGLAMIRRGHAAEYTYDVAYRRQSAYQQAESGARAAGRGLWGRCGGPDEPLHQPGPKPGGQPRGDCAPGYDPCVPPYPPDVDCDDVDGPVRVSGSDPHGLDADGDGTACES